MSDWGTGCVLHSTHPKKADCMTKIFENVQTTNIRTVQSICLIVGAERIRRFNQLLKSQFCWPKQCRFSDILVNVVKWSMDLSKQEQSQLIVRSGSELDLNTINLDCSLIRISLPLENQTQINKSAAKLDSHGAG